MRIKEITYGKHLPSTLNKSQVSLLLYKSEKAMTIKVSVTDKTSIHRGHSYVSQSHSNY